MWRPIAPPLDGEVIRQARIGKLLTQAEVAGQVAEQCADAGIKFDRSSLSLIENGRVKHPAVKVIPALAQVLGLEVDEMFMAEAA